MRRKILMIRRIIGVDERLNVSGKTTKGIQWDEETIAGKYRINSP